MSPNVDASPLPDGAIQPGQLVFDTVYNPVRTKLLSQAASAGARAVDGVTMFVGQAAAQFEHWTGLDAPLETMQRVVLERLGK
ncbi:MAG: shikimate dehydrogenase, partial [Phycisphaerae bacterium]|nr:shikimate dehydrogenase [Phycisphaerae bacterium]